MNYWRTASTELVALAPKAPWVGAVGSFATDPELGDGEHENHQYLEYDPVPGERHAAAAPGLHRPAGGRAAGSDERQSDDMKSIMGLYDASLGAKSNETSGRAILARQREGDVSHVQLHRQPVRAIRHAGRIICRPDPEGVQHRSASSAPSARTAARLNVRSTSRPSRLPEHAKEP
jgi:hypothetical protein